LVEQLMGGGDVVCLAGGERQAHRQAAVIDQRMDLCGQPAARPADRFTPPFFVPAEC
jgi:hypothetical protein